MPVTVERTATTSAAVITILINIIIIDNWCCGVLLGLTFIQLYNITVSFNSYLYVQVAMVYTFYLFSCSVRLMASY